MDDERLARAQWLPLGFLAVSGVALVRGNDGLPQWFTAALLVAALTIGAGAVAIRPTDMLAVLALSVPVQDLGAVEAVGMSITLTRLCLGCLVIGWAFRVASGKRVAIDSVAWGYAGVGVALAVSIVAGSSVHAWAGELYRWMIAAFVYIVARSEITEQSHVHRLLAGISAGVIGVSVLAIRQVLTSDGPPSFVVNGVLRAYGSFGQPNPLAAYLELSLPMLLAVTIVPLAHQRWPSLPLVVSLTATVAIVVGIAGLALTQSRGGWLGFTGAGVVLLGGFPLKARAVVAAGAALALGGILGSGAGAVLTDRLASLFDTGGSGVNVTPDNWPNQERRAHWGAALNMFRTLPWTGVGAGGFDDAYREYTSDWRFRVSRGHAHNGYLHMAAQAGVGGLLGFSCWVGAIAHKAVKRARALAGVSGDARALGGLATIVAFGIHSMVDYLNVLSLGIQLALAIAVAVSGPTLASGLSIEGAEEP